MLLLLLLLCITYNVLNMVCARMRTYGGYVRRTAIRPALCCSRCEFNFERNLHTTLRWLSVCAPERRWFRALTQAHAQYIFAMAIRARLSTLLPPPAVTLRCAKGVDRNHISRVRVYSVCCGRRCG